MRTSVDHRFGLTRLSRFPAIFLAVSLVAVGVGVRPAVAASAIVATPVPTATGFSRLSGVTCTAADRCWAVGDAFVSGFERRLVLRWNGTGWSIVTTPLPTGTTSSRLFAVTCAAADTCWAVGEAGPGRRLVLRWNGTAWSIVTTPLPTGTVYSTLSGVTCTAVNNCWAVGYFSGSGAGRRLVLRWNGTAWSIVTTPLPTGTGYSELSGVTCTAVKSCWAVGFAWVSGTSRRLVLRWNGTAWSIVTTPLPTGTGYSKLSGVTCNSADNCWAVGYFNVSDASRRLVLRWNGTAWSIVTTPLPSGTTSSELFGVTCTSVDNCWAVGSATVSGVDRRLVIRFMP